MEVFLFFSPMVVIGGWCELTIRWVLPFAVNGSSSGPSIGILFLMVSMSAANCRHDIDMDCQSLWSVSDGAIWNLQVARVEVQAAPRSRAVTTRIFPDA
ncbi:hypothetical protein ACLOJK_001646 [Asimina triloba]